MDGMLIPPEDISLQLLGSFIHMLSHFHLCRSRQIFLKTIISTANELNPKLILKYTAASHTCFCLEGPL